MKTLLRNTRMLIVGAGLMFLLVAVEGCSQKMGCPGGITTEKTETPNKPS